MSFAWPFRTDLASSRFQAIQISKTQAESSLSLATPVFHGAVQEVPWKEEGRDQSDSVLTFKELIALKLIALSHQIPEWPVGCIAASCDSRRVFRIRVGLIAFFLMLGPDIKRPQLQMKPGSRCKVNQEVS